MKEEFFFSFLFLFFFPKRNENQQKCEKTRINDGDLVFFFKFFLACH